MKFVPQNGSVHLVSMRSFQSKNGKDLTFVKVADRTTYDSQEFLLSRNTEASSLVPGMDYEVEIDVEGRFTTIEFIG